MLKKCEKDPPLSSLPKEILVSTDANISENGLNFFDLRPYLVHLEKIPFCDFSLNYDTS